MTRPRGIMICLPAGGQMVTAQTNESLFRLAQYLTKERIENYLSWFSAADIEDIRNLFVSIFYDRFLDCSHLLFVDADMGFPPELVRDMIAFGKPVTGVLYARRNPVPSVVGTIADESHSQRDIMNGFMKVNGLGCGVMLIERGVITKMLEKDPDLSDPHQSALTKAAPDLNLSRIIRVFDKFRDGNFRLSEDMSFCRRWLDCGGELWANVDHMISHVGPFDYCLRYAGILENKAKAQGLAA